MSGRALLIGNGPSALAREAGDEIDAFDGVVVRFNEHRTAGFERRVGSRTDEWATWMLFPEQSERDYARVLYTMPPPRPTWPGFITRYPRADRIADGTFEATRERMGYELPSSGAFVAMHYVLRGWAVVLHGFDFFQGARHHYADDGTLGYRHSPLHEAAFFRGLIREGRIAVLGVDGVPKGLDAIAPDGDLSWRLAEYRRVAGARLAQIAAMQREIEHGRGREFELRCELQGARQELGAALQRLAPRQGAAEGDRAAEAALAQVRDEAERLRVALNAREAEAGELRRELDRLRASPLYRLLGRLGLVEGAVSPEPRVNPTAPPAGSRP